MATVVVSVKAGHDAAVVQAELVARGLWVERLEAGGRVQFVVEPHSQAVTREALLGIAGVEAAFAGKPAHPRMDAQAGRAVVVAGVAVGGGAAPPVVMAGPCSVESEAHIAATAARLAAAGVRFLRGGAFKPRTSPYAFQGHGERALGWLRVAADAHGLAVVTEVMSAEAGPLVAAHADLLQVGSRNMQNYALLAAVARLGRPVLLKRGMSATVEEWLLAGEYLLVGGAPAVILCERGVRGFDPSTRNVLDLGAVALLSHVHGLPVVVDPSHAVGRRDLVPALARAALAAGAAGLMVETHDDAGHALSDGPQALTPHEMQTLMDGLVKEVHRG
ncbi:MAG: 3-deoxy-7-phosphoheptulonate synthase [Deltaproteobacteria bacterium]|nr:3-deoxy-7-phosphoheptulonate synthase [Deltaproteobacteria bacterium]